MADKNSCTVINSQALPQTLPQICSFYFLNYQSNKILYFLIAADF